jgi:hypothetical protein
MTEPENLILVRLRELRAEIAGIEGSHYPALRGPHRRDRLALRRYREAARDDAANGPEALQSFIGHRSMVERTIDEIGRR